MIVLGSPLGCTAETAYALLDNGGAQAIHWNAGDPEMVARHERMYPERRTLYVTTPFQPRPQPKCGDSEHIGCGCKSDACR